MLILKKNEEIKYLSPESSLIPILKNEGWSIEGEDNIETLREEADKLGIEYHHKAGAKKLKELIEEAKK